MVSRGSATTVAPCGSTRCSPGSGPTPSPPSTRRWPSCAARAGRCSTSRSVTHGSPPRHSSAGAAAVPGYRNTRPRPGFRSCEKHCRLRHSPVRGRGRSRHPGDAHVRVARRRSSPASWPSLTGAAATWSVWPTRATRYTSGGPCWPEPNPQVRLAGDFVLRAADIPDRSGSGGHGVDLHPPQPGRLGHGRRHDLGASVRGAAVTDCSAPTSVTPISTSEATAPSRYCRLRGRARQACLAFLSLPSARA